jgi:hypothetical protein
MSLENFTHDVGRASVKRRDPGAAAGQISSVSRCGGVVRGSSIDQRSAPARDNERDVALPSQLDETQETALTVSRPEYGHDQRTRGDTDGTGSRPIDD